MPVMEYMRAIMPLKSEFEKLTAICFDEMNLSKFADLDRKSDMALMGKNVQTVMVRGITSPWKFPVYTGLDLALTKEILFEIIVALEGLGLKVLITTCDQGILDYFD